MLRKALLRASRNDRLRHAVVATPGARDVVERFVAGESFEQVLPVVKDLDRKGLSTSLDILGEDATDKEQAALRVAAYREVLHRLADEGLANACDVSVKLSALGQNLPDGPGLALDNAAAICRAARNAGITVTLDMEDHATTTATLSQLRALRQDFPSTGVAIQAYLRRSVDDCADLATSGSRVRLCKGAYNEPSSVAFTDKHEVELSFVNCLRVLMEGPGYPMIATHNPRLIAIAEELARSTKRDAGSFEFQMLYGIRPLEQRRLADLGYTMRVYVPFGTDWYGYFMRRLAERPANVGFFLRSVMGRR